jgi:hypothetical protein
MIRTHTHTHMPPVTIRKTSADELYKQGSRHWNFIRKTMITGSKCGLLFQKWKNAPMRKLIGEYTDWRNKQVISRKDEDQEVEEFDTNRIGKNAMAYGSYWEEKGAIPAYAEAVKHHYYALYPNSNVQVHTRKDDPTLEVFFYIQEEGVLMASPDSEVVITVETDDGRTIVEKGVLEVKCPVGGYAPKIGSGPGTSVEHPITYEKYSDLLKKGRYAEIRPNRPVPNFPAPRFSLTTPQKKEDAYIRSLTTWNREDSQWGEYYCQCVANLMLSDAEWIDFCVWTSGQLTLEADQKKRGDTWRQHHFWYKTRNDPHPNVHIERMYKSDPKIQQDWNELLRRARKWTVDLKSILEDNIAIFIAFLRKEREDPDLSLESVLIPPEACPDSPPPPSSP